MWASAGLAGVGGTQSPWDRGRQCLVCALCGAAVFSPRRRRQRRERLSCGHWRPRGYELVGLSREPQPPGPGPRPAHPALQGSVPPACGCPLAWEAALGFVPALSLPRSSSVPGGPSLRVYSRKWPLLVSETQDGLTELQFVFWKLWCPPLKISVIRVKEARD